MEMHPDAHPIEFDLRKAHDKAKQMLFSGAKSLNDSIKF